MDKAMYKQENANGEGKRFSSSWSTGQAGPESKKKAWPQGPGYSPVLWTAPGRTVNKQLVLKKCSLLSFMSKQCSVEKALNLEAVA